MPWSPQRSATTKSTAASMSLWKGGQVPWKIRGRPTGTSSPAPTGAPSGTRWNVKPSPSQGPSPPAMCQSGSPPIVTRPFPPQNGCPPTPTPPAGPSAAGEVPGRPPAHRPAPLPARERVPAEAERLRRQHEVLDYEPCLDTVHVHHLPALEVGDVVGMRVLREEARVHERAQRIVPEQLVRQVGAVRGGGG